MVFTISAEISIVYRFLMTNPYCALEERRWLKSKDFKVNIETILKK